ncbi:hypothetical protein BDQ12DRAFT_127992 [Crucibulum laeve]|uniref:Uncharacterized protein n=1 Tax=Crucibulum laeve TaxID=68775 RepID=A0A5C3M2C1_9AGAR|nr:hypothetical protein BDQ12DRAFT_127992 [Crucibulum laeve]
MGFTVDLLFSLFFPGFLVSFSSLFPGFMDLGLYGFPVRSLSYLSKIYELRTDIPEASMYMLPLPLVKIALGWY